MPKRKTHEEYEQQLLEREIDYWPIESYVNSTTKILHECLEGHKWYIMPQHILANKGCPQCSSQRAFTAAEYQDKLTSRGLGIDVLEAYVNNRTPIDHRCINKHIWKTRPSSVLSGYGCPHCAGNSCKSTDQYIDNLREAGITFDVLEQYTHSKAPILHRCDKGHSWKAMPNNVLRGTGCPTCSIRGFNPDIPAILYYIKITSQLGESYYKIGITNNTVRKRFEKDPDKDIEIIKETYYEVGQEAKDAETAILQKYKSSRKNISGFLKSAGNTELFEFDVLGLTP